MSITVTWVMARNCPRGGEHELSGRNSVRVKFAHDRAGTAPKANQRLLTNSRKMVRTDGHFIGRSSFNEAVGFFLDGGEFVVRGRDDFVVFDGRLGVRG